MTVKIVTRWYYFAYLGRGPHYTDWNQNLPSG